MWHFKKAEGTWPWSSPGTGLRLGLVTPPSPSASPRNSEEEGDILFSLHSEIEGRSESRASKHGWKTMGPKGQRAKRHHASFKPLSRRKSVIYVL